MELYEESLLCSSERGKITLGTGSDGKQYIRKSGSFDTEVLHKLSELQCPFVASVAEYSAEYVIMEYISGEPLSAKNLPADRLFEIFSEICNGISALHAAGIIHRDIKPSNIMLTDSGKIKIIDFDAARIKKPRAEKDTVFIGTDGFAAPEQYGFMQTDERSDIYAFGVTMKLLLGEKYMSSPYRAVADKCMRFDPQKRYPSIASVKKAIFAAKYRWAIIGLPAALVILIAAAAILLNRPVIEEFPAEETLTTAQQNTESDYSEAISETAEQTQSTPTPETVETIQDERTYQWAVLISPVGFPKLTDKVSSFEYNCYSSEYRYSWNVMSDDEAGQCLDKLAEWLGDYEYNEYYTLEGYEYSLHNDNYIVKFTWMPHEEDNTVYGAKVYVYDKQKSVPDLSGALLPENEQQPPDGSQRSIKWEDIDFLYNGFPKLTDSVTEISINEEDNINVIAWDLMDQTTAAAFCLKIAESMNSLTGYNLNAREDGFMEWTISGDDRFIYFSWFSDDWLSQYYQAQVRFMG